MKKEFKQAEKQGITFTVEPEAREWLLAQNDQPEFGARPLRRIIGRYLREPLADFLLSQSGREKEMNLKVVVEGNKLVFKHN